MNTMRDVFISTLYDFMAKDESIFFVTADLGAPALDKLREDYPDRVINVGIAEQNCINIATGLALEGCKVYAYGIAPFISMRCLEQCRINLALSNVIREMNLTILGLGGGLSYDISGPSHHCLEDLSLFRTLPGIEVYSPSNLKQLRALPGHTLGYNNPRYVRLDGKPCPEEFSAQDPNFSKGYEILKKGCDLTIVATGAMIRTALEAAKKIEPKVDVQVVDVFRLDEIDRKAFFKDIASSKAILTLEEGFIGCGGLDSFISFNMELEDIDIPTRRMGMARSYDYSNGDRAYLHKINGITAKDVADKLQKLAERYQ